MIASEGGPGRYADFTFGPDGHLLAVGSFEEETFAGAEASAALRPAGLEPLQDLRETCRRLFGRLRPT